jgi:hypothetical protein
MASKSKSQIEAEKNAKETAIVVEDALRSIADTIGDIFTEALSTTDNVAKAVAKDITGSLNSLAKVSKDLASANIKAAEGAFKQADAAKLIQQRQAKIQAINYQISMLGRGELKQKKALNDELEKVKGYNDEFEQGLQEQLDLSAKITKQMGLTGAVLGGLKTAANKLGLGSISDALDDANTAALSVAKNSSGLTGKFKVLGAAMGSLGKSFLSFLTDPVAIIKVIASGIVGLIKLAGEYAGKTADVGKAFLGLGNNVSGVTANLEHMAASDFFMNFEEAFQAMKSLNAATGTQVQLTHEQTSAYQKYTNLLGLSEETTQGLFKQSTLSGESFDNILASTLATVDGLNNANGLSLDQNAIMEDVANASAQTSFHLNSNPKALSQAAFDAKRLGMTMAEISNAARSTLDFESSIEKEMKAEMILGKELNLETLRHATLTGDVGTQASEINRILTENIDSTKGNVIAQEALADSLGMSVEQMFEANRARLLGIELSKQGIKDREKGEKAISSLMAKGYTQEEALLKLQKEGLANIENQAKASQSFSRLTEQLKETFISGLVNSGVLDKINTLIKNFMEGGGMEKISKLIETAAGKLGEFIIGMIAAAGEIGEFIAGMMNNPKKTLGGLAVALGGIFLAQKMVPQLVTLVGGKALTKGFDAMKNFFKKKPEKVAQAAMKTTGKVISGAAAESAVKAGSATVLKKTAAKSTAKVGAKLGVKALGKSVLKKIPGVGLLAGIGFGLQRAMEGDFVGAAMELASGGASLIPGFGTAASVAIDAASAARDFSKATSGDTASDFISRPGQPIQKFRADDIIMGGTNLTGGGNGGGEIATLLKELISAVKQGGDVYIDGAKAGRSLALATSKMG